MGFATRRIDWIMLCIKSVSYSILVNCKAVGPIYPGKGLRQGDHLSSYLFIICTEGLSALIVRPESRGDLHGIKICRGAPIISHLLFTVDSFLFFRANEREVLVMKEILSTYENATGQAINLKKSEVYYSRNIRAGSIYGAH